ncbi:hypothetical protein SAMN04487897_1663 [Paenibacillus sp. yr247]|uniref:hypothetical protein n=1 Tax=Paenibacillus sp. yr247 TaxID=1761880 RepID=UPI000883D385|nr:hypothetical protein [Paenibacillus sp. yr247]SDP28933.1 hypothetical protein SAMN04487897_1663 [Paenibacillus sp. yr247]
MKKLLFTVVILSLLLGGCQSGVDASKKNGTVPAGAAEQTAAGSGDPKQMDVNLSKVTTYLIGKSTDLQTHTVELKKAADQYYELAKAANFDYATLWNKEQGKVRGIALDCEEGVHFRKYRLQIDGRHCCGRRKLIEI